MKWLRFGLGFGFGLGYTNPSPNPKQVSTMKVGDSLTDVAIDAGFGEYSERACATLGIEQAPAGLKAGMEVMLQVPGGKQRARVTEMTDTSFTLDANHPLAGKQLELDVELLAADAGAAAHETRRLCHGTASLEAVPSRPLRRSTWPDSSSRLASAAPLEAAPSRPLRRSTFARLM